MKSSSIKQGFVKILDGFFLLRIPLLAPVWTILMVGWITAQPDAAVGGGFLHSALLFREVALWKALFSFSLIVAFIYVVNQIVDIEGDRLNNKLFLIPYNYISVPAAWVLAIVCAAGGLILGIIFFDSGIIVLFLASLLLGILYDLPPVNLKNHALGGVIANFLGHGVLTFLVGWYVGRSAVSGNILDVLRHGLIPSLAPGFANAAVFLATTIPDKQGDMSTGKRTFCVAYGEKITGIVASVCCCAALLFSFSLPYNRWVMGVPAAVSSVIFIVFAISPRREFAFTAFKWPVFLLSAFVALFVPLYGVLIIITFFGSRLYYKKRFGIDYPTFKSQ
jgi:4-hydroxybenzoate polyprenyltransferase